MATWSKTKGEFAEYNASRILPLRKIESVYCAVVRFTGPQPATRSDGKVIRHAGRYLALFGSFGDQLLFGLIPKPVPLTGKLPSRLPELMRSGANFVFTQARHPSFLIDPAAAVHLRAIEN